MVSVERKGNLFTASNLHRRRQGMVGFTEMIERPIMKERDIELTVCIVLLSIAHLFYVKRGETVGTIKEKRFSLVHLT